MPNITVDGIEYNTEDLSDNGKAQLALTISRGSASKTKR